MHHACIYSFVYFLYSMGHVFFQKKGPVMYLETQVNYRIILQDGKYILSRSLTREVSSDLGHARCV